MRVLGMEVDGQRRLGVVDGEDVIDLQAADNRIPFDLAEWLRAREGDLQTLGDIARAAPSHARRPLNAIRYALPVARPNKIVCLGLNYMKHVKEGRYAEDVPKHPTIFFRCLTSLTAHRSDIVRPRVSETFDYEAELAVVIGRRSRHLTLDTALESVVAYTCANEGTIREYQRRTTQWDMGKNFDQSGSMGPWLVTAEELPPGGAGLDIQCRLNGQVMQSDNTENMMFPLRETLVAITEGITLEPGDIVLTGTPSGVGHARKPPVWMKHGDVCEVEIEGVGILRNNVVNEQ
jgi:2-keto-4-pentenoate hydratase/2-oxohepta-3-ene-1,7-dioic acid hydratase in catechol pathway